MQNSREKFRVYIARSLPANRQVLHILKNFVILKIVRSRKTDFIFKNQPYKSCLI